MGLQQERLAATAAVIASLSGEAAAQRDRARAYAAIRSIGAVRNVVYARIETADGELLSETGSGARLSRDVQAAHDGQVGVFALLRSRTIEVTAPVLHGRETVGRVVLLAELEGAARGLLSSLILGLLAALVAAGAGLAVAWRLQSGIAGPILSLTGSIAGLREAHDFAQSVEVAADDETADLVEGFNELLAEIRRRDEAIAEHMAGLERTVAERTADLKAAKEAADAANSAKSDFLATMSHEIRTPMNGIMVMAEMLAAGDVPPRQRRFAEVIAKSGSSLLAIINDILDFSKIEAGKLELEAAPVDPGEIAEDVCSLFWERARSKGLDLAACVAPEVPARIRGDAVRLRQVVGNLVNNAIKFTETGGVLIEITAPGPDRLRVAVRDTGIGIPAAKLPQLFSAFTQADQSTTRRFGGTGLGLAICKRLVEAMGGQVAVRSVEGQGSVFGFEVPAETLEPAPAHERLEGSVELRLSGRFTRPAVERRLVALGLALAETDAGDLLIADAAAAPAAAEKRGPVICLAEYGDAAPAQLLREGRVDALLTQPFRRRDLDALLLAWRDGRPLGEALASEAESEREQLPSFAGARVLVVDDSAVNREVALEALARLQIDCAVAGDGREALDLLAVEAFDLVLMDGSMPVMDGYEAARQLRRREAESGAARTPVVALTAHVVGAAAEAWREAGMDAVLHKPFTLASLAGTLGEFLRPGATAAAAPPPRQERAQGQGDLIDPVVAAELAQMAREGRGDFVQKVRRLYREHAPEAAKRVIAAADAADTEEAARRAHALKSMSLNVGARAVAELAARIESDARDRGVIDRGAVDSLYRKLLQTLEALDGAPAARTPQHEALPHEDRALLDDLAGAAGRGELSLVFQPQVDRDGRRVLGLEALLRWRSPTRGDVSPALFIPLAERHGLIRPITRWVLDEALAQVADLEGLTLAVNASALEFAEPEFIEEVATALARHRFDPARLEIEVTETAILGDGEAVRTAIARLHELGVKVALDDFGVGYSSLNHLRVFAFDKLKIDRVFVTDCAEDVQAAALVHAVVSVGRALGMKIVAEGVETEAQHKFLKLAGVHAMQGFLHSRPEAMETLRPKLMGERRAAEA